MNKECKHNARNIMKAKPKMDFESYQFCNFFTINNNAILRCQQQFAINLYSTCDQNSPK